MTNSLLKIEKRHQINKCYTSLSLLEISFGDFGENDIV
jgi:hypothetical protein